MDEKDNIFPTQENDTPEMNSPVEPEVEAKPDYDNGTPWYQQSSSSQQSYTPPQDPEPTYSPYSTQQSYSANYYQNQPTPPQEPEKKSTKGRKVLAVFLSVVVVLCAVLGAFLIKDSGNNSSDVDETKKGDAQLQIQDANEIVEADSTNAVSVYEKVSPSCVGIILYSTGNSLFSSNNSSSTSNIAGQGSGIIMGENSDSTRTYIITCAHVISSAGSSGYKVVVQDYTGEQYDATVVGFDSKTDLGVLSIAKTGLKAAEFGDSSQIKIGETVYAIGNPGGTEFFGSFTKGMVSAIDRSVSSEIGYDMKCIQHDAAINPGNSGGALINASGQIIGINSSKIASTEYEGMGFAIPISSAQDIINDIIANGYVTNRPKLGIKYSAASNYQQYAMVVQIK